ANCRELRQPQEADVGELLREVRTGDLVPPDRAQRRALPPGGVEGVIAAGHDLSGVLLHAGYRTRLRLWQVAAAQPQVPGLSVEQATPWLPNRRLPARTPADWPWSRAGAAGRAGGGGAGRAGSGGRSR